MYKFLRGLVLKALYPLLLLAGGIFKGRKDQLQIFMIKLNNRLVLKERPRIKNLLLLLPHCLQVDKCNIRITTNIYNCERCGKCQITRIIEIAEANGMKLSVATGGNLARRIVKEVCPEAIIAVACERDLASGIADTYPLPVLGILNERPFGPCLNTKVSLEKLKDAIAALVPPGNNHP
jgi:hypothetical protein